ncbi:hypothetical protein [Mycobacteroides saopaulense]|uniref:hypothetical protein n=1 Tax=Mycobacteroides saopaulense TaxID=1578165 RepID=UPI000B2E648F|nr:hypothetical protein [Mycobacteroides saopaulense]
MSSIQDLAAVVTPLGRVAPKEWTAIDSDLGFVTPADYRSIIDTYGSGSFDDFLIVLSPQNGNKYLDLSSQIAVRREALHGLTHEVIPYPIDLLTACAYTNNGDVVYWLADKAVNPNDWPVVINASRDDEWDRFNGGLLDFLVAVLDRSYVCPIFPDDFPEQDGSYFTPSA